MRTLFSASRVAHFLFTSNWARLLKSLCCCARVASPPHSKPVTFPIQCPFTPGLRRASWSKLPYSTTQHKPTKDSNSQLGLMSLYFYHWATHAFFFFFFFWLRNICKSSRILHGSQLSGYGSKCEGLWWTFIYMQKGYVFTLYNTFLTILNVAPTIMPTTSTDDQNSYCSCNNCEKWQYLVMIVYLNYMYFPK